MAQCFDLTSRVDFKVGSSKGAVTLHDQEREHSGASASFSELSQVRGVGMGSGVLTPGRRQRRLPSKASLSPPWAPKTGRFQRLMRLGAGAGHSPFTIFQMYISTWSEVSCSRTKRCRLSALGDTSVYTWNWPGTLGHRVDMTSLWSSSASSSEREGGKDVCDVFNRHWIISKGSGL